MFNTHWHVTKQNVTGTETSSENLGVYEFRDEALNSLDRIVDARHELTSPTFSSVIYSIFHLEANPSPDFYVFIFRCECERGEDELAVTDHYSNLDDSGLDTGD